VLMRRVVGEGQEGKGQEGEKKPSLSGITQWENVDAMRLQHDETMEH
jgi:hypothetical protein